jgi:protein disulfide-isomerase A6
MMNWLFYLLFGLSIANALYEGSSSHVRELDNDNYKQTLDNVTAPVMLVEFYAPWCGHCKSLVPIMNKLSKQTSKFMPICSVNCEDNRDICEQFDIQGFPTIKIGYISQTHPTIKKTWVEYNGPRTVDGIRDTMSGYCPSFFILPLSNSDAPHILRNNSYLKVFVFPNSDQDLLAVKFLAWHMRDSVTVYNGLAARQTIKSYFRLDKFPFLLVQTSGNTNSITLPESNTFTYSKDHDMSKISLSEQYTEISTFLNKFVIKLPELHTGEDFTRYCLNATAPLCLIALIRDPYSEESLKRIRILEDISKNSGNIPSNVSPFVFMWINRDIHDDVMINYDPETYQEKTDPDVLIFNSKREKFGAWFGKSVWDKQSIMTMLDEIKIGNTRLMGDPPQFHPFYEWMSAERQDQNEKQDL